MFLVPLDRRREWYRYHALFREFLLGELRRVEPEVIEKLHLRAADWYESNGSPAMAVEHLLNTTERDRCVQLVTELILPTYQAGQMSTVQRWLSALGDSAIENYPPLAVLAGWIAVFDRADRGSRTLGGDRRRRVVRPGAVGWLGVVRLGAGDVAGRDVSRRPGADAGRREPRGGPGAAVEPVARRRAAACAPRRICSPATSTGRRSCSRSRPRWPPRCPTPIRSSSASRELALLAMDSGRWAAAAGHVERALDAIEEHRMHDYAISLLAFAAAARLAVHRGDSTEVDRQLAHAMRARPSCTFVLPFLRRAPTTAAGQGLPRHRRRDDRRSPAQGDRRHPGSPPRSRRPGRRGRRVPAGPRLGRASRSNRGAPLSPAELRLLPVPADAPDDPRDRGAAVRLPQHRQLRDRLDLPETGRLLTQRSRANGRWPSACSASSRRHGPDWCSSAASMSYPSAIASFGAAATTLGSPTTGTTPTSTSTISAAVAPAPTAASACAP